MVRKTPLQQTIDDTVTKLAIAVNDLKIIRQQGYEHDRVWMAKKLIWAAGDLLSDLMKREDDAERAARSRQLPYIQEDKDVRPPTNPG